MMSNPEATDAPMARSSDDRERVFLVVVDESEEMEVALHFASRRAKNTGGRVALLHVQEPAEFQHWIGVEEVMRQERREEAEALMQKLSSRVMKWSAKMPILFMREGSRSEELFKLMEEEPGISIIVLAAGVSSSGPGPIITFLLQKGISRLKIPITIVPGSLSEEELVALS